MSLSVQAMPKGRAKRTYTFPATSFDVAATSVPVMIRSTTDAVLATHAKSDGSNLRFIFPNGTVPPQTIGYTPLLQEDVSWSVESEPYAVRHTSDGVDRTFVGLYRHQESALDIGQYDHRTGEWTVTRLADITEVDDHNGISIAVHPDGSVFAICPQHGTANLRAFRSNLPADIASFTELSFGAIDVANASFAQPLFIGTTLFISWRDDEVLSQRPRVYTTSDDKGTTWTTRKTLVDEVSERPYCHLQERNGDIHVWFSKGHETEVSAGQNHIYHGVLRLSFDSFYAADGTLIGTTSVAPLSSSNATLVMSAATSGYNLRTAGGGFDASGNPVCGINEIQSTTNVYHHARWNGSAWSTEEVVTGGETLYGPYGSAEPGYLPGWRQLVDGNVALASVQLVDKTHEVRKYTRSSGGAWSYKVISSANSTEKIRPVEVVNGHAEMQYLYLAGEYHTSNSSDNRLDLCAYPGPVTSGRLTALVEVDFDGSTDVELQLVIGDTKPEVPVQPLSDASVLSVGEIGRRTILDDTQTVLDGLAQITVVSVITPKAFSSNQYFASDYSPVYANRHLILRLISGSGRPNFMLVLSDGVNYHAIATDVAGTAGERASVAASYNGTMMRLALDGTLSANSTNVSLALKDSGPAALYAGASPHESSTAQLTGSQDFLLILPVGKSTNWLRLASLGCGLPAYTEGVWEDLPRLVFQRDAASATVVGEVLQN